MGQDSPLAASFLNQDGWQPRPDRGVEVAGYEAPHYLKKETDMPPRKPSKMKRTGKAVASPRSKAAKAAKKLGGYAGKAASAITKNKRAKQEALKKT